MLYGAPESYGQPPHAVETTAAVSTAQNLGGPGFDSAAEAWDDAVNRAAPPVTDDTPDVYAGSTSTVQLFSAQITVLPTFDPSSPDPPTQGKYYASVSFGRYFLRYYTPSCYLKAFWNQTIKTITMSRGVQQISSVPTAKTYERTCPALFNGFCLPQALYQNFGANQSFPLTWVKSSDGGSGGDGDGGGGTYKVTSDLMRPPDPDPADYGGNGTTTHSVFVSITDLRWSCVTGYAPAAASGTTPAQANGFPPNPETGI